MTRKNHKWAILEKVSCREYYKYILDSIKPSMKKKQILKYINIFIKKYGISEYKNGSKLYHNNTYKRVFKLDENYKYFIRFPYLYNKKDMLVNRICIHCKKKEFEINNFLEAHKKIIKFSVLYEVEKQK